MKKLIAEKLVSWIIEIAILGVVATITISEVRETNAKTQELLTQTQGMLDSIAEFAGDRSEAAGAALDSVRFMSIVMLPSLEFVTTRSMSPSRSKSPTAIPFG